MAFALPEAEAKLKQFGASQVYFDVLDAFKREFPEANEVTFVRAPGRVNIIGEHTDYNGLPVFPMAIDREIVIAIAPNAPGEVDMVSTNPKMPRLQFTCSCHIPPYEMGHWGNYAKAAAQAAYEWARENAAGSLPLDGIKGVLGGSIPHGAGLSSSSALVVAIAVALMRGLPIEKPEMADLLAKGEHYVGTQGGGMDQTCSLMGKKGYALKIDFAPLRTRPTKLPEGYSIVIANTMVTANKTGSARVAYNTRVAECRLGLEMLKHDAMANYPAVENAVLLRDFMDNVPDWDKYLTALPDKPVTLAEVAEYVGASEQELTEKCLTRKDGTLLPIPEEGFFATKRCRHVLTEAARVNKAADASENGDAVTLGKLMNESHASCANDYEISCPELDKLVGILRNAGALGARLTGAGFGGFTVSLVPTESANAVMNRVWQDYYQTYLPSKGIPTPDRGAVLFSCLPSEGAGEVFV